MQTRNLSSMPMDNMLPGSLRGAIQCVTLLLGDLCAFVLATVLAILITRDQSQLQIYGVLVLAWLLWFGLVKMVYTRRKPFWTELWQIFMGLLMFATVNAALSGMGDTGFARPCLVITWLSLLLLLPGARTVSRFFLCHFKMWCIPTLIIGNGENAKEAYLALKSEPSMGFDVKAFALLANNDCIASAPSPIAAMPIVFVNKHPQNFQQLRPFHCVIALEAHERELRDTVIRLLNQNKINDIHVIPSMRGVPLYGMETSHFFSHEVLLIQLRNNLANPLHRISKRVFDVFGSISLLLLLSPLFALLAYKVGKDGGEPFFGHLRVGQNGQLFKCYKFRSMVINAEEVLKHLLATDPVAQAEWEQDFKLKTDPRVSQLGAFLRRSSLDEIPQLWNVLKGDMSLVGPRPVVQAELERYGEDVDYYLMAKPGMTGLWQVSGRNDVDYATRVYLDSWYVKNWSLWTDIAILFKTISVVTGRSGAY